ncbi:MAG: c-type cytochrome [Nitrospinae bacterium]|nr:c-type cytochrome [Nitrospinota bacterium]
MRVLFSIVIFSLAVIFGFAGYTRFGLPLIIPAPPPQEAKISGEMTMDQFIALGKTVYEGKGTCTLCHNSLGRAPLLEQVAQVAPERLADARYKGEAKSVEEYIHESMVKPSAYVVAGFGKKGTNDTVSPMPDVSGGAINLNAAEMAAVIAFLQDVGGVEVTAQIPTGEAAAPAAEGAAPAPAPAADAKEALVKFGCNTCHMHPLIAEGGDMGPDLAQVAATAGKRKPGMSAEQFIVESIIDPNATLAKGFEPDMMPPDFAQQMTVAEMNMIVAAILNKDAAGGKPQ